ncbi:sphingosine N-acyltransferase lag1 [Geranomyces variabilis]|nr:sphingosine N-acyltransferase lag1 [Geranomyces variabilis]
MAAPDVTLPADATSTHATNPHTAIPRLLLRLLSYDLKTGTCHEKTWNDVVLACGLAGCFLLVKASLYKRLLPTLADRWKVPNTPAQRAKFHEQAWLLLCHTVALAIGLAHVIGTPQAPALLGMHEGLKHFWIGYPHDHIQLEPKFKLFYFCVLGYWLHHVVALTLEGLDRRAFEKAKAQGRTGMPYARSRSDFWPLAVHHAVTVGLVVVSYYTNFTRIGQSIMVVLDVADVLLPLAKILKYAGHTTICDTTFAVFAFSWLVTRHWILLLFVVSIWRDSLIYIPETSRAWAPEIGCFYSKKIYWLFLGFFGTLQVLLVYWLALIVKVVLKVMRGAPAEDVRSDSEDVDGEGEGFEDRMEDDEVAVKGSKVGKRSFGSGPLDVQQGVTPHKRVPRRR